MPTNYYRTENKRSIDRLYEFAVWCKENKYVKTLSEWESACGIGSKYLGNTVQSTKGSVGAEVLERVYRRFPMLNLTWVVTGDGDMLDSPYLAEAKRQKEMLNRAEALKEDIIRKVERAEEIRTQLANLERLTELANDMRKVLKKIPK